MRHPNPIAECSTTRNEREPPASRRMSRLSGTQIHILFVGESNEALEEVYKLLACQSAEQRTKTVCCMHFAASFFTQATGAT